MPSWVWFIIIGAPLNAVVNLGYKFWAKSSLFLFIGSVSLISALCLIAFGLLVKGERFGDLTTAPASWGLIAMGLATPLVAFCFVSALTKGPISLVDPLYACLYALASVLIGMVLVRENPSPTALAGIGFYLVGAFLMARK